MSSRLISRLAVPTLAVAVTFALVIGAGAPVAAQSAPVAATTSPVTAAVAPLTDAEEAGLLFMLEEEKLAHDLYVALGDVAQAEGWALPLFDNIARAETVHSNAVLRLLTSYGVDVSAVDLPAGAFLNTDLQALYDTLLAQGSTSRADALTVGALVEETDIADLDERMATSENATILRVYAALRRGSTYHLQAFTGLLDQLEGSTYAPQVLSDSAYAEALAAERGGPQGRGGRRGH